MPKCKVHKVEMSLEPDDHNDDGLMDDGTQYWDDKYVCPRPDCGEDDWISWNTSEPLEDDDD